MDHSMPLWSNDPSPRMMAGLLAPIDAFAQQPARASIIVPDLDAKQPMESKSSLRSCTTCSKAKAKCVRQSGALVCERCARLKKECHLREPVVRRRKVTKTTRAAQLEKLESKIEHLVNALASQHSHRGFSIDLGQPSPPVSNHSEPTSWTGATVACQQRITEEASNPRQQEVLNSLCGDLEDDDQSGSDSSLEPESECAMQGTPTVSKAPVADYQQVGVPLADAEILLDRFKRLMAPGMPFVVLPINCTAQQLYTEKPTLLHAIVVVSSFHSLAEQQSNVKRLLRNLSERIMINCEKSIDILQAIMVFVGWYHPHIFWSQQCTNLLHLAIAMVIDLGFDRPQNQCQDFRKATHRAIHGGSSERVHTAEELRLLLGAFYLTSTLSSSFKKIDAMPWTPYMEQALQTLESAVGQDSDLLLVQLVRLQHLIEETVNVSMSQGAIQMYVKAFAADLARLRRNDTNKGSNVYLELQYRVTEVLVWEIALNDLQENCTPLRCRLDDMCQLIDALRSYLDLFFTLPQASYLTMPFSVFAQFAHSFIVLIKIASLEVEGWDMQTLTSRIDFLEAVEQAAIRFEGAATSKPDNLDIKNDHFSKWALRVRWMKTVYEAKFVQNAQEDEQVTAVKALLRPTPNEENAMSPNTHVSLGAAVGGLQQQQLPQVQQPTPPDDVLSGDFFSYWDENFWQSFAGDFDLGFPDINMT